MIRTDVAYVGPDGRLTQAGWSEFRGQETRIAALDTGKAPRPQTASGTGNWQRQFVAASTAFVLPAGGTLAWVYFRRNNSTGAITAIDAGVSAGGTNVLTLGAGEDLNALVWRLAP